MIMLTSLSALYVEETTRRDRERNREKQIRGETRREREKESRETVHYDVTWTAKKTNEQAEEEISFVRSFFYFSST